MRFVSNRAHYQFVVQNDEGTWRRNPQTGTDVFVPESKGFTAEFKHGGLTSYEVALAMEHWVGSQGNRRDGSLRGMGAHPMIASPSVDGQVISGLMPFHPQFRFSVFDTEWINDPEMRAYAEERLCNASLNNNEHMLVIPEAVPQPWPGYDKMRGVRGKPLAETIATHAVMTDTVAAAYAYESATRQRDDVLKALEAAHAEVVDRAVEDDALSATVPS